MDYSKKNLPNLHLACYENLVSFLKNDGLLAFDYEIEYENLKPFISEKSGTINLWHKNFNGTWTINLYYINRILKTD